MSSEQQKLQSTPPLYRPKPRRPFEASSSSTEPSHSAQPRKSLEVPSGDARDGLSETARNRSFFNLTSSTLLGIYAPTALGEQQSESQTPWGTGAETPARNGSIDLDRGGLDVSSRATRDNSIAELEARLLKTTGRPQAHRTKSGRRSPDSEPHQARRSWFNILAGTVVRVATLFVFGVSYGALVAHLHDDQHIAPVAVDAIDRTTWRYLIFWGLAGVGIGSLLPWVDFAWARGGSSGAAYAPENEDMRDDGGGDRQSRHKRVLLPVEWNDVVRSVGAFVGIAFAIRKLSWSSTLQLSGTLALANPFLWYLLDRTGTGFTLSTLIGLVGTAVLSLFNPGMIPSPAPLHHPANNGSAAYFAPVGRFKPGALEALINSESVAVVTWTASVLFCSCVCFGNIGRVLVSGSR